MLFWRQRLGLELGNDIEMIAGLWFRVKSIGLLGNLITMGILIVI